MPDNALLGAKKIPTDKAVGAAILAIVVISTIAYLLNLVSYERECSLRPRSCRVALPPLASRMFGAPLQCARHSHGLLSPAAVSHTLPPRLAAAVEVHFHIFHPENAKPNADGSAPEARPGLLIALVLMYPLLTILGMVLVIPLAMYVTDHAPFQSLNVLRPDHFIQLVVQVYRAWLSSAGGKLKPKDL